MKFISLICLLVISSGLTAASSASPQASSGAASIQASAQSAASGSTQAPPARRLSHAKSYDYAAIGIYLLIMLVLGLLFRKFNETSSDYFKASSKTVWWMVGASSFMTAFSAWTFTGAASQAYKSGISIAVIFIANTVGFLLNAAVFAPWYRQTRATTLPEIIRTRYNPATQQFYAWVGVIFSYLMAGLHLWGVSIFLSALFGFPMEQIIIVIGIVVVIYTAIGGSWSVMAHDFVQCLILIPITILVSIQALMYIGGFGGLIGSIHEMGLESHLQLIKPGMFEEFALFYCIAVCIKQFLIYNCLNDAPKYFNVKDGREAQKAALLAAALMFFGSLLWFIPPIVARLAFSDIVDAVPLKNPSEAAYAVTSIQLLPPGFIGLMAITMLAATTSTMDASLNRNSAVVTRDIIRGVFFKKITERGQFVAGQIITVVSGMVVISLALYFSHTSGKGIFDAMMKIGGLVGVPKLIPLFLGMFMIFRRAPQWSALISTGAGFTMSVFALIYDWPFPVIILTNVLAGGSAYLICYFVWRTKPESAYQVQVDGFMKKMRTPVDFAKEVGADVDYQQFRIIGLTSTVIAICILSLMIIPGAHSRVPYFFVSGFVGTVGVIFLRYSLVLKKRLAARTAASVVN